MEFMVSIVLALIFGLGGFSLHSLYFRRKDELIQDVRSMLAELRKLDSWDDLMSEDHLQEWLGFTSEEMFHRRSLLELRNIMNNLCVYARIHSAIEDDDDLEVDRTVKTETMSLSFLWHELLYPDSPHYTM
jgi:hypothetical protein